MKEQIITLVAVPLLVAVSGYLIAFLRMKTMALTDKLGNDVLARYVWMAEQTVSDCVRATSQVYVDTLKKSGTFGKKEQEEAFNTVKEQVLEILDDEVLRALTAVVKDLDTWFLVQIEKNVSIMK